MSISVIIPTSNRASLVLTIDSLWNQLQPEDEVLVEVDHTYHSDYGNWARDKGLDRAKGTHVWFLDDDDAATPFAFQYMREAIALDPECIWVFKLVNPDGSLIWKEKRAGYSNTTGTSFLIPKEKALKWGGGPSDVTSDHHYALKLESKYKMKFSDKIIGILRPSAMNVSQFPSGGSRGSGKSTGSAGIMDGGAALER